jgi:hypothetical protein
MITSVVAIPARLGKDTTKPAQTEALTIERELGKKARYGGGVFSERWQ